MNERKDRGRTKGWKEGRRNRRKKALKEIRKVMKGRKKLGIGTWGGTAKGEEGRGGKGREGETVPKMNRGTSRHFTAH